jgi:hypothetical protein
MPYDELQKSLTRAFSRYDAEAHSDCRDRFEPGALRIQELSDEEIRIVMWDNGTVLARRSFT